MKIEISSSELGSIDRVSIVNGSLQEDIYGCLYIDKCKTEKEHILAAPDTLINGAMRRSCRVYVEDLFPAQIMGKSGRFEICIRFVEGADE